MDDREKEEFVAREMARQNLYFYSRWMFLKRKGFNWVRSRHHKLICDTLTRVFNGDCRRLIINVPPRYGKTELAVLNFISWAMGRAPDSCFLHVSYASHLAVSNSYETLAILQHPEYQAIFPSCRLKTISKADWSTTEGGGIHAAGSGGSITGFGGGSLKSTFSGAIIIDDPHKSKEGEGVSDVSRRSVIDWFGNTLESRANNRETPIVLIMQRLHQEDLSGFLLGGGNGEVWEHLCLPAIQEDGSALWPEKHNVEELTRMERANPYVFAGQYMQSPTSREGNIFRVDGIRHYDNLPDKFDRVICSWDCAFKDGLSSSYVVGQVWGKVGAKTYLIDQVRQRMSFTKTVQSIVAQLDSYPSISACLIEDKANGPAILDTLKKHVGCLVPVSVDGSKEARAHAVTSYWDAGNVYLPKKEAMPWVKDFLNEVTTFPAASNDDQVDAMSQGLRYLYQDRFRLKINPDILNTLHF